MNNTPLPVDADTIHHTYESVLLSIRLPTGDALDTLNETLQGHVQLLAPEVRDLSPRMPGETRRTAVHILVRTSHLLKETTGSPTAQLTETYDLAVTARALLTLYLRPGPLGSPTAEGEIAEQIGQRLCGVCWEPIEDDEPYERRPFDSNSAGAIHGYVHVEPCVDRPSLLVPVPLRTQALELPPLPAASGTTRLVKPLVTSRSNARVTSAGTSCWIMKP